MVGDPSAEQQVINPLFGDAKTTRIPPHPKKSEATTSARRAVPSPPPFSPPPEGPSLLLNSLMDAGGSLWMGRLVWSNLVIDCVSRV